jgi:hypothetical protein
MKSQSQTNVRPYSFFSPESKCPNDYFTYVSIQKCRDKYVRMESEWELFDHKLYEDLKIWGL